MKSKIGIWVVVLAFCGSIAGIARADHTWNGYHWANKDALPIPLIVIDSVTSDWQSEFDTALTEWSTGVSEPGNYNHGDAPNPHFFDLESNVIDDEGDSRSRKKCAAVDGRLRVCNANYGGAWLGLASINLDQNGHIIKGTAKVNDFFSGYWDSNPHEKRHVMCQETGHVLGLDHTSEDGSVDNTCMDYSDSPTSISPNQADYDHLETMYVAAGGGPTDDYNSYDDGTGGSGSSGGEEPNCPPNSKSPKCTGNAGPEVPPMGVLVHKGKNHEIWVARGRGKTLWIHHIRLAPEEYR